MSRFQDRVLSQVPDNTAKAKLLLGWSNTRDTWAYVEDLGGEVREQYWRHLSMLPNEGSVDDLLFAIDQYRSVGRDIEVLGWMQRRSKDVPSGLLLDMLASGVGQAAEDFERMGNMLSYYIGLALKELRTRSDVEKRQIANAEYAYLPLLRQEREPLIIYDLLASDPEMFVDVLSHVFRGKSAPVDQIITQEAKARANTSYDLLSEFKIVPGFLDGKIDANMLSDWVRNVKVLAAAKDLVDIGDNQIGFVLAYAPQDVDEHFWPPSAVCKVIEVATARKMEQVLPVRYCYNDGEPFTEVGSDLTRLAFGRYIKYWHLVEVAVAVREKCAARAFACDHKESVFRSDSYPRLIPGSAVDVEIICLCKVVNNCAKTL
jgi:hypothetical protein